MEVNFELLEPLKTVGEEAPFIGKANVTVMQFLGASVQNPVRYRDPYRPTRAAKIAPSIGLRYRTR